MKLTILGCRGAYPNKDEGCSGYLIQEDNYNLLIDCGSGVVSALQNYINLIELAGVVISHYHADHYSDISVLQHGVMIESKINNKNVNIPIYGQKIKENFKKLTYKSYTVGKSYLENTNLKLGPFTLNFLKTHHSVPCFAFGISQENKKIVYTADTSYFKELENFSQGADLLIAESSLYPDTEGQQMGHMNSKDAATLAKNANVKNLLLTHLPNYGDNNILFNNAKNYFNGNITMSKSGFQFEF